VVSASGVASSVGSKRLTGVLEGIGRALSNPASLQRVTEDREAIGSAALEGI
jgi:hypothetical protein